MFKQHQASFCTVLAAYSHMEMLFEGSFAEEIDCIKKLAYWIIAFENPASENMSFSNYKKTFKKMDKRDRAIDTAYKSVFGKEETDSEQTKVPKGGTGIRLKSIINSIGY